MKVHPLIHALRSCGLLSSLICTALTLNASDGSYTARGLVSNLPAIADHADPNALNSWGLVVLPDTLIVAQNHANLASFYQPDGRVIPFTIDADEDPTGMILNPSPGDFVIGTGRHRGSSVLLFATEAGTILGWNPAVNRGATVIAADNSDNDAIYKGLAVGRPKHRSLLYATDFHNAKVDVYDHAFHLVSSFTDPTVDPGFAPFNVVKFGDRLFVTFALQKGPDNEDDQAGAGNGFIDIFDLNGHMLSRFASHGTLNSPWGMARAPRTFGKFSNALLVGNFGDGAINAFDFHTGAFLGQLEDSTGTPIAIDGLWSLEFGRSGKHHSDGDDDDDDDDRGARTSTLYFTAGPGEEENGLVGQIVPN